MAAAGSGAVFFLGTRAHYQVLQQPESQYDAENGNASTETIYQNPSVQGLWNKDHQMDNYMNGGGNYCGNGTVPEEKEGDVKRRDKRRASETVPCEDMKPAVLNNVENTTPKSKPSRIPFFAFLTSLSRRKKKCQHEQLQHLESALLTTCTYRESCRCLDCQSRYFECDEAEEDYSNSEEESEYLHYLAQAMQTPPPPPAEDSDDDEVFVDKVPEDNTSTDLLLEAKMSVSSSESEAESESMNIEVAAGAPILLTFLLSHPITCVIQ